MKRSKYSPQQIIKILDEFSAGSSADELSWKYKVSQATIYNWRRKYGGLQASELKRLNALEKENNHLKRMYAELAKELLERSFNILPKAKPWRSIQEQI